jgi:hypothetical protein
MKGSEIKVIHMQPHPGNAVKLRRIWLFPLWRGGGCFILLRESKKGGSSGAQQLFTSYFYKQTVPTERKYSLFDGLSKTLQSSRLFVAINEDIIALRRSRLKANLQRMKQPWVKGDYFRLNNSCAYLF